MISVEKALQIVLNHTLDFGIEEIPFLDSVGRVLQEDIVADRDFPPFNRVAMDGIAINHRFFEYGVRDFKIEGIQAAGAPQEKLDNAANCYEVMTGAVLPENTDTVIRYEDVQINSLIATVNLDALELGKNIHQQGKDRRAGEVLIPKNTVITAAEIGVIATVGKPTVKVSKTPGVMIVSTGDELVEVNQTPQTHQIRRSNAFSLASLLQKFNIQAHTAHITDDKEQLKTATAQFLKNYDVLLFSGAVSKGKFDYLPEVLEELGVEKLFHRVAQRPGKPFWYGVAQGKSVFAFPGNPVSTYVNCLVYFYPWFAKSAGFDLTKETVILNDEVTFKPDLTYFLQVKTQVQYGHLVATPVRGNGSGDLASLVQADGFIELPAGASTFSKGETYNFIRFR